MFQGSRLLIHVVLVKEWRSPWSLYCTNKFQPWRLNSWNQICACARSSPVHQRCFTPPMTPPLTFAQSMLASSSSSISPHTATFSPLMRYSPWGTSVLCSGSSGGRITLSSVWPRTRFVNWSHDNKIPVNVLPSAVRMSTDSWTNKTISCSCSFWS